MSDISRAYDEFMNYAQYHVSDMACAWLRRELSAHVGRRISKAELDNEMRERGYKRAWGRVRTGGGYSTDRYVRTE